MPFRKTICKPANAQKLGNDAKKDMTAALDPVQPAPAAQQFAYKRNCRSIYDDTDDDPYDHRYSANANADVNVNYYQVQQVQERNRAAEEHARKEKEHAEEEKQRRSIEKGLIHLRAAHEAIDVTDLKCTIEYCASGSSNEIHDIYFSDDPYHPQWILKFDMRGEREEDWTEAHARHQKNVVDVMRYLKETLDLPVPKVYDHSETSANVFGRPFVVMERVPGKPLGSITEEYHRKGKSTNKIWGEAIRQLASIVHRLDTAQFMVREYGSAVFKDGKISNTGPIFFNNGGKGYEIPPRRWAADLLLLRTQRRANKSRLSPEYRLLRMLARIACAAEDNDEVEAKVATFFHPDLNPYNILVDEHTGKVTGVIDWDSVFLAPRSFNIGSFPRFVAGDWYYDWCSCKDSGADEPYFDASDGLYRPNDIFTLHQRRRVVWKMCIDAELAGQPIAGYTELLQEAKKIPKPYNDQNWVSILQLKNILDFNGSTCICEDLSQRILRGIHYKERERQEGAAEAGYKPTTKLLSVQAFLSSIRSGVVPAHHWELLVGHFAGMFYSGVTKDSLESILERDPTATELERFRLRDLGINPFELKIRVRLPPRPRNAP